MADFIYIDETGSVGKGASSQPHLTLVAVLVHEDKVQRLSRRLRQVAMEHLGWLPADFEFHGNELWHSKGAWKGKQPSELLAAYEAAIGLLAEFELSVVHASIHKERLHQRYNGYADDDAYRLALQFLLEKIDRLSSNNKILVADESKEQELKAIEMVADMQEWGGGEVPGRALNTVIDSMHFVRSSASPGVQIADLVAFIHHREQIGCSHPDAQAAVVRMRRKIWDHTATWRETWPPRPRAAL